MEIIINMRLFKKIKKEARSFLERKEAFTTGTIPTGRTEADVLL